MSRWENIRVSFEELLKRSPNRRGPFIISDDEIRQALRELKEVENV